MRSIPSGVLGLSILLAAILGATTPGCSSSSADGPGTGGRGTEPTIEGGVGGSGGAASGSGGAPGWGGSSGGSASTGGSASGGETCAGKPCASHTGDHGFVADGAPADAAALFDKATAHPAGTDAAKEPAVLYPSHETMFPINVTRIRHEWSGGTGNGLYRLSFAGPKTTVSVYTTATNWLPGEEEWDWIAESNRGEAVSFTVAALDPAAPSEAWVSAPVTLLFSKAEVEGAIYYWSTGTKGIMKALVSDSIPLKFYTDPAADDADQCVACHTVSRDGKRLAVGYGGEKLREVSVPDRKVLVPSTPDPKAAMNSAWTTFSPDGSRLLVAANGKLTLIDSDTGAPVGGNNGLVPLPAGKLGTHPDWSALGDRVVVTLATKGGNKEVEGGSIAILTYDGASWSAPDVIVASSGATDNNFFPVWSPDSKWIAYVNATAKSKDAVSSTLRLFDVQARKSMTMTRINQRVNNEDGVTGIANSMPTWAPSTRPGIFWLAFSSVRAYATVRPQSDKEDQIWIGAVDPTLKDPGYAAFWAPFQSLEAGNHRAFWTHTSEDTQCRCVEVCGDHLDNDCDGAADETGCSECAEREICGDDIDNDCNCLTDECTVKENCTDGIDNDGDGNIDRADPACYIR